MNKIILPENINDIELMNPGCDVDNIIGSVTPEGKDFEFYRTPRDNLEFRQISSLDNRYEINENGTIIRNCFTGRHIKIFLDTHHSKVGYYATFINYKGIVRRIMIHTVVAECWLGPRPEGFEIDHIDRNPHNNHYTNLRYVTHSEQMRNRILSPRIIEQAKLNCQKYVTERVMKPVKVIDTNGNIREYISMTECAYKLAHELNYNPEYIRRAILGKRRETINGFTIVYVNEKIKQIN